MGWVRSSEILLKKMYAADFNLPVPLQILPANGELPD
jgi:hypothetical protein